MAGKLVAVIGAGPAGLVAAKSMLEVGLSPIIFDKEAEIGGMWNPKSNRCWDSLKTNISRHTTYFSDFPWDTDSFHAPLALYPSQREMLDYLEHYARKFLRPEHLALGSEVKSVSRRSDDGKWIVHWSPSSNQQQQLCGKFDFVVFATGLFGIPYTPSVPGLDGFKGEVMHSSQYRNPDKFVGKRVVVVGTSFSAAEVAAEVALAAAHVVNIGRRPVWVFPRCVAIDPDSPATSFIPFELAFHKYSKAAQQGSMEELYKMTNVLFRKLCGHQGPLTVDPERDSYPPYITISDTYMELVRSSQIEVRLGEIRQMQGCAVILDDGSVIDEIDCIIFGTGYRTSIPYLSKDVLDELSFDPTEKSLPLLLDRATFHPSLPGSAFLGIYGGPTMVIMELQARWAAAIFSGALPPVPDSVQLEGIAMERQIKDRIPRPQFPHGDHVRFATAITAELNVLPSAEWRAAHDVLVPAHFRTGLATERTMATFEKELEELMDGKMVPQAVFRSLAGKWTFHRRIENRMYSAQSGTVTGTATFFSTGSAIEYLYSETGELVLSGGVKCKVYRKYVYVYDTLAHRIDVFFENQGVRGELFHSLRFLPRESSVAAADKKEASRPINSSPEKGWRADGQHLCVKDMYYPSYLFQFSGNVISKMEISYSVDGPQKNYTSTATYVR